MHWSAYTIFSVLSGVAMLGAATFGREPARSRAGSALAGAAFIAYGVYVAEQTTGTWVFPVWVFVIPFAALARLVLAMRRQAAGRPRRQG